VCGAQVDALLNSSDTGSKLRARLGKAVRDVEQQQLTIGRLRAELREARTQSFSARRATAVSTDATAKVRAQTEAVLALIGETREERARSVAAAAAREHELQAVIEQMKVALHAPASPPAAAPATAAPTEPDAPAQGTAPVHDWFAQRAAERKRDAEEAARARAHAGGVAAAATLFGGTVRQQRAMQRAATDAAGTQAPATSPPTAGGDYDNDDFF